MRFSGLLTPLLGLAALSLGVMLAAGTAGWMILAGRSETPASVELPQVKPAAPAAPALPPVLKAPAEAPRQIGEAFVERFGGRDLDPRWAVSDGWSNGPWMANDWRASRVSVADGVLRLGLGAAEAGADKSLSGGEIRTHAAYRFGRFEIRMRAPRGPGIVTGVFSYARADEGASPEEIDIEIAGRNTRVVEVTYHQAHKVRSKKVDLPFDAADGFHTYAFDWAPEELRWYADGKLIHAERGGRVGDLRRPQNFLVSLWGSSTLRAWTGEIDPARGPWSLEVSCVAYAPLPASALCGD